MTNPIEGTNINTTLTTAQARHQTAEEATKKAVEALTSAQHAHAEALTEYQRLNAASLNGDTTAMGQLVTAQGTLDGWAGTLRTFQRNHAEAQQAEAWALAELNRAIVSKQGGPGLLTPAQIEETLSELETQLQNLVNPVLDKLAQHDEALIRAGQTLLEAERVLGPSPEHQVHKPLAGYGEIQGLTINGTTFRPSASGISLNSATGNLYGTWSRTCNG